MRDRIRHIIGCMTGTSIDALDVALVQVCGSGYELQLSLVAATTTPLGPLARPLRDLAAGRPMTAAAITQFAWEFGELHAHAIHSMLGSTNQQIDLIAAHGQTVFHAPPYSWQLLNPAPIVASVRTAVVCDFRQADLAAGGQGAPITPIADWILFQNVEAPFAIANLGGFCNMTIVESARPSPSVVRGADICACNQLLDGIARERFGLAMDENGALARAGTVRDNLLDSLLDLIAMQQRGGRSLGTGDELEDWIRAHSEERAEDLLATACEAIGKSVALGCGSANRLLLAGGGTKNPMLLSSIKRHSRASTTLTDEYGVPAAYREAMAMAVLGALCADQMNITLPQVTHRGEAFVISGTWVYPKIGS